MKKILLGAMVMMLATAALFAAGQITRERAMEIALADAGVSADGTSFVRSHLDRERGREVYDIEFYIDNMEYDYEIDAATGEILSVDRDAEYWGETSDATISEEEAVRIALEDARVDETQSMRVRLDRDDWRLEYEVEFTTADREYEYTIDASSGRILETDVERGRSVSTEAGITIEEARRLPWSSTACPTVRRPTTSGSAATVTTDAWSTRARPGSAAMSTSSRSMPPGDASPTGSASAGELIFRQKDRGTRLRMVVPLSVICTIPSGQEVPVMSPPPWMMYTDSARIAWSTSSPSSEATSRLT